MGVVALQLVPFLDLTFRFPYLSYLTPLSFLVSSPCSPATAFVIFRFKCFIRRFEFSGKPVVKPHTLKYHKITRSHASQDSLNPGGRKLS